MEDRGPPLLCSEARSADRRGNSGRNFTFHPRGDGAGTRLVARRGRAGGRPRCGDWRTSAGPRTSLSPGPGRARAAPPPATCTCHASCSPLPLPSPGPAPPQHGLLLTPATPGTWRGPRSEAAAAAGSDFAASARAGNRGRTRDLWPGEGEDVVMVCCVLPGERRAGGWRAVRKSGAQCWRMGRAEQCQAGTMVT